MTVLSRAQGDAAADSEAAAPQWFDTICPEGAEHFRQIAARVREQARLALNEAGAVVNDARVQLAAAEQRARAVGNAVRNLEPIADELETRSRTALVGHEGIARLARARERTEALEAEYAKTGKRLEELAQQLAELRTERTETLAALTEARRAGAVAKLEPLRARDAALAEVIPDLEEQERVARDRMSQLSTPGVGLESARHALSAAESHLAGCLSVNSPQSVTDAWTTMAAMLRALHDGTIPDERRDEIEAVLRTPELAGIYERARSTLEQRLAAGEDLDQDAPNAVLQGGPGLRDRPRMRVRDGVTEVRARCIDGRDHLFRRTGANERVEDSTVLSVFKHAGFAEA